MMASRPRKATTTDSTLTAVVVFANQIIVFLDTALFTIPTLGVSTINAARIVITVTSDACLASFPRCSSQPRVCGCERGDPWK